MADKNPQNARIGRTVPIIGSLTVAPIRLTTQEISTWVNAVNSARSVVNPLRRQLHLLYENLLVDGQLATVVNKRKIGVTNKKWVFYKRGADGETVDKIQEEIIDTTWWTDLLNYAMNETFWGHELIELVPGKKYPIEGVNEIPHFNVLPEKGWLLPNYANFTDGIPFRGDDVDPFYDKYLIEFGKPKEYGLLMSIAQYVIYKRGGFGDWAQFAEIFGMPFRIGEYDPYDDVTRKKLEDALKYMGGAGYAVIPQGTSIKFENGNSNTGQSAVYKDLINLCDEQISKIVLGGTMTTDNGSSHSQSEVHKIGQDEITKSDIIKISNWLNGPFRKKLIDYYGYSEAADGYFKVEEDENISLLDRSAIDDIVAKHVKINPEYWYKRYNVMMPKGGPEAMEKPEPPPTDTPPVKVEKKKANLSQAVKDYYTSFACSACAGKNTMMLTAASDAEKEAERLARLIFNKKLKSGSVDKKLLKRTAAKLMEGITTGYLRTPGSNSFTADDEKMVDIIRENVFVFSGFKTEKQIKDAAALLLDDNGKPRLWPDFKAKALELDHTYNTQYLSAEYNHAVASSQMASKWLGFKNLQDDFPNLVYQTAGDDRVRPSHVALDGIVKPMDDTFWNTNYPPNGWNCRCDVDATDAALSSNTPNVSNDPMFNNNVGKDGIVFPKSHPYYEASKAQAKRVTDIAKSAM